MHELEIWLQMIGFLNWLIYVVNLRYLFIGA